MIVTRIVGGLGNQMFQYAAGRALATRLGVELKIDRRAFSNYQTHSFGLQHFKAKLVDALPNELPKMASESTFSRFFRNFSRAPISVFTETAFTFNPKVLTLEANTYLDGYWQSENYFQDFSDFIRADFQFEKQPSNENKIWLLKISNVNSVSLHIRRGDYVSNASANSVHGTCDLDYYYRAVKTLAENIGNDLEIFVFSDDPDWVTANLSLSFPMHIVRHNNAETNYEDLRLMTACRHHIIANSSFSWWGAWLDPRPDSLIIAPKQWFRTAKLDPRDLIPDRWVKV